MFPVAGQLHTAPCTHCIYAGTSREYRPSERAYTPEGLLFSGTHLSRLLASDIDQHHAPGSNNEKNSFEAHLHRVLCMN